MDRSKKHHIDQWVEDALYKLLEETMTKRQITALDVTAMTPLLQMYQAIQLERVCSELESLWRLLADGEGGISIHTVGGEVDVNVKQIPQDEPPQPKKR